MMHSQEDRDREAMNEYGAPFDECSKEQQEAVEFGLNAKAVIRQMQESGAKTIGELVAMRARSSDQ